MIGKGLRVLLLFALLATACPLPLAVAEDEAESMIPVDFNGVQLDLVIKQIQRHAKVRILYDDKLLINKKVTLVAPGLRVPKQEALEVLRRILQVHQLILARQPGELDSYTVLAEGQLLKTPNPVYEQGDTKMPGGAEIVTQLFTLKHLAVTPTLSSLQSMVNTPNAMKALGTTGVIMVTGRAANVKRIAGVIKMLDVPQPKAEVATYHLKNARADRVKLKVEAFIKTLGDSDPARANQRAGRGISVIVNERTNAVIIFATAKIHEQVKVLVEQLDTKTTHVRLVRMYKIKNTEAAAVAYMLGELLDADVAAGFAGTDSVTDAGEDGGAARPSALQRESKRHGSGTETETYGEEIPMVIPDLNQNALLVRTTESLHKEVVRIIAELDARRPQVLIEVAIVEISDEDATNVGIELMAFNRRSSSTRFFGASDFSLGTLGFDTVTGLPSGKTLRQLPGVLAGLTSRDQIPVLLHALQTKTNARVLSTPSLLVNDNKKAVFRNSVSEPTTTTSQGETTTEVSFGGFEDAELSLEITPRISEAGYITLTIVQTSESFVGEPAGVGIPPPRTSTVVRTTVTIPNDETIVIGGLTTSREVEIVSSVPLLGDIPLLGELFTQREKSTSESKIYMFIRPLILDDPDFTDLKKYSQETLDRLDGDSDDGESEDESKGGESDDGESGE